MKNLFLGSSDAYFILADLLRESADAKRGEETKR